ncbi:MAG: DUF4292 domain-containing protein [Tannerella sp.]|jgi:hypothetical protein|nr:DUF4292 domain-containing protein [Tannerella sp.]
MRLKNEIWKVICGGVLLAFSLSACKTTKSASASEPEIMKTEEALFASVIDRSFHFNTLNSQLRFHFNNGQKEISSKAQLKMIRNDRLQLSVQPMLGIEVFRLEMTSDSIKVLDRMNKRYMTDSYDHLKGNFKIDFNFRNLQALITNQMFVPNEDEISASHFRRFRINKSDESAEFALADSNGYYYTFTAGSNERLISTNIEKRIDKSALEWDYRKFQDIENRSFPMEMAVKLLTDSEIQGEATLIFSSMEIDKPLKTEFIIPKGYERITAEQLIKSFGQK